MAQVTIRSSIQWWPRFGAGSPGHRALLAGGAAAPVLFVGAFLAQGAVRPGYAPLRDTISALMNGDAGWGQRLNFAVFGILVIGFAAGLRIALVPGIGAIWVPRLKALEGLCLMAAGIFPDPVHTAVTVGSFTLALITYVILARRFWTGGRRGGWVAYSIATGLLSVTCLALFGALGAGHGPGPAGLFEKLATAVNGLYTLILALTLLLGSGRIEPREQSQAR